MDRFLTVNDFPGSRDPHGVQVPRLEPPVDIIDVPSEPIDPAPRPAAGSQGPCLYLGPQGQRCEKPAIEGGFCARHQSGVSGSTPNPGRVSRIAAAGIGIAAAMWPIVFDVLRVIYRWIHAR